MELIRGAFKARAHPTNLSCQSSNVMATYSNRPMTQDTFTSLHFFSCVVWSRTFIFIDYQLGALLVKPIYYSKSKWRPSLIGPICKIKTMHRLLYFTSKFLTTLHSHLDVTCSYYFQFITRMNGMASWFFHMKPPKLSSSVELLTKTHSCSFSN